MTIQRKVTVRLKYGKRGFSFLVDGSTNSKRLCYYTKKRALLKGVERFLGSQPYTIVDGTGMSHRNNKKK